MAAGGARATIRIGNVDALAIGAARFADRTEAGRALAAALAGERGPGLVVVGLARGGVQVAAEVARALAAPLDVLAVRKVRHPWEPEYALGAVTPGDGVYLRGEEGLAEEEVRRAVREARAQAVELDRLLHAEQPPVELAGRDVLVVDDGLATGATMVAALRWARTAGAARVVAAVPVAPPETLRRLRLEADEVVCLHAPAAFFAVGAHYDRFPQVGDGEVTRLIRDAAARLRPSR